MQRRGAPQRKVTAPVSSGQREDAHAATFSKLPFVLLVPQCRIPGGGLAGFMTDVCPTCASN